MEEKSTTRGALLCKLFFTMMKIGLFTFGGGYAMIPLIQREVIDNRRWIAEADFLDLLTVAQSAPGPISLNTSGVVLPSFVIILAVAMFFADIRDNAVVDAAFKAMRPAVVALIIAPIVGLTKGMRWWLLAVAAAVALVVWGTGISPIYILLAGAAAGLVWSVRAAGKEAER